MEDLRDNLKLAASRLTKKIKMSDLISISRLYSSFPIADDRFYNKLHNIAYYKLQFMRPEEVAIIFMSFSMLHRNPKVKTDFTKFFTMSLYKILKSMHSLDPELVSRVILSVGQSKLANKKILRSYKRIITKKSHSFDTESSYRILLGWIMSGRFIKDDQKFLDSLFERVTNNLEELKPSQVPSIFYYLYGQNLASIEFEYYEGFEEVIFSQ